jgi:hypothetical protein
MRSRFVLVLSSLVFGLSGCFVAREFRVRDASTWRPIGALLHEGKYPEAAAELQRVYRELNPPVWDDRGNRADFGDQLDSLAVHGALPELETARAAAAQRTPRADAMAAARRGLEALSWLDGLPVDDVHREGLSRKGLDAARAELEAVLAELSGLAARQMKLLEEDEAAGRLALAVYGWTRFVPENAAQAAIRGKKLHALSRALAVTSAGTYTPVLRRNTPADAVEALNAGKRLAKQTFANVSFTGDVEAADAVLELAGAATPQVKRSTASVSGTWEYPTGTKEAENPKWRLYQDNVRDFEKTAARSRQSYEGIKCKQSGSAKSQVKAPAGTCAQAEYQSWKNAERRAADYRARLERTPQRTTVTVFSQHTYTAREDTAVARGQLVMEVAFKKGKPPVVVKIPASITRKAVSRAADPRVKMPAQAEVLPSDEALLKDLQAEQAVQFVDFIARVRETQLEDTEQALEAARAKGDVPLQADLTLRLAAARTEGGLGELEPLIEQRLGGGLDPSPTALELLAPGSAAIRFEQTAEFGQAELDAGRYASALATWVLIEALADPDLEARRQAALRQAQQGLSSALVLALSSSGAGDVGSAVAAALQQGATRLRGFKAAPGAGGPAALRVTVDGAAPRIARERADVTLEREVREESEDGTPSAPEKVSFRAQRAAATLQGTVAVKAEWAGRRFAFELPVKHVEEALSHDAQPALDLDARAESLPKDEELVRRWATQAGRAALERLLQELHAPTSDDEGPVLDAALLSVLRSADADVSPRRLAPLLEPGFRRPNATLLAEVLSGVGRPSAGEPSAR